MVDVLAVYAARPGDDADHIAACVRSLPVEPVTVHDKSTADAALSGLDGRRLVVVGSSAGLNAVVVRLLRRSLLDTVPVGVVLSPADVHAAVHDEVEPRGLVRDDHGGIVLRRAVLTPWEGRKVGVRAYVEDEELVNSPVKEFSVRPGDGHLVASARRRTRTGRAVTLSCAEARLTVDGEPLDRPQVRRTWWYEADRWLATGARLS